MRRQIILFLEELIAKLYDEYEFELSYYLEGSQTKILCRFYIYETEVLKEFEGSESVIAEQLKEYQEQIIKTIKSI